MELFKNLYPDWLKKENVNKNQKVKFLIKYENLKIAELTIDDEKKYVFKYTDEFKDQHGVVGKKYVRKITGFKDLDKIYRSKNLYPFFLARIPDPNRPIIKEIIEKEKIDKNNPLELLERFAKTTLDNPFIVEKQDL